MQYILHVTLYLATLMNSCTSTSNFLIVFQVCLFPDLRRKVLHFSSLRMILIMNLSYMAFMMLKYVPSIPTLLIVLIKNGCCVFTNVFSSFIERMIWFFFF